MIEAQTEKQNEELKRNWIAACHASALLGLALPFGNILGPLVVWLMNKDRYREVMLEGKLALNFQITASIILLVGGGLLSGLCILLPMMVFTFIGFGLVSWIPMILAGIKAYNAYHGQEFEYPCSIRFIK